MNKPLRKVAIVAVLLLGIVMINLNYVQGSKSDDLKNHRLNNRALLERFNYNRGDITAGAEKLAWSKDTGSKTRKYQREYTKDAEVFLPVTGFYGAFGQSNVESAANSLLNGTDKRLTARKWWDNFIGKKAPGATVETTIKPGAQRTTYQALRSSTGAGLRGAAVAIDIKSGAIRTMASFPSVDTNRLATNDGNKAKTLFDELNGPQFKLTKPALNKATEETYAPGSGFKIVTGSAAMETGRANKDTVVNTGSYTLPESGRPLNNDNPPHGVCAQPNGRLFNAFSDSCNTTFGKLAVDMTGPVLAKEAGKFGFGQRTEIEDGMFSAISTMPATAAGDSLARSGIGQESVTASPLQMAMVAQAVANGGNLMKPHLIDKIKAPDGSTLEKAARKSMGEPLNGDNAGQLQEMMRAVTTEGTARGKIPSDIAGKTGTGESGRAGINFRWFVGFAPANDPKIAFAVVSEGPGYAAGATAPVVVPMIRALTG